MKNFIFIFLMLPMMALGQANRTQYFDANKYNFGQMGNLTKEELYYLQGVTSNIQTQLDGKQATITGSATTVDTETLTNDRAMITDGSGKISISGTVSTTELGYLDGVSSALQTQLDGKTDEVGGSLTNGSVITPIRSDVKQDTVANLTTYAATASDGQLVYATDEEIMYQIVNNELVPVGSGSGLGDTDTMYVQTFEDAKIADFIVLTGWALNTASPLNGEVDAKVTHDTTVTTYEIEQDSIPVPEKFRNKNITFKITTKSTATAGNLVLDVGCATDTDMLNSEVLQFTDVDGGEEAYAYFDMADTCTLLSYSVRALPETGPPVSSIDDIEIKLTKVEVMSALVQSADTLVRLYGSNGYGSTNTRIARFTTLDKNIGSDILYSDSATLGASFTVLTAGTYSIHWSTDASTQRVTGLSVNSTQLTTNISSISAADRLSYSAYPAGLGSVVSYTGYFNAGDVIRPHADGSAIASTYNFSISKQGSLKQATVNTNQKIKIPTSEVRFEGASARGAVASAIVKFDTLASLKGDAFTIVNTANDGTYVQMKKNGRLSVSAGFAIGSGEQMWLSKNHVTLNSAPLAAETIGTDSSGTGAKVGTSWTGDVAVGDTIRVVASLAPTSNAANHATFSFQEQEVQVSVSNTLPQYTENDQVYDTDTQNGAGSTSTKIRRFSVVRENTLVDATCADSATLGLTCTVNKAGIYTINFCDQYGAGAGWVGISKNSASLTTDVGSLTAAELLAIEYSKGGTESQCPSWTGSLAVGDVVRPHIQTGTAGTLAYSSWTMSKIGKPNVTGVDVTPFVEMPNLETDVLTHSNSTLTNNGLELEFVIGNIVTTNKGIIQAVDDAANTRTKFVALRKCVVNFTISSSVTGTNSLMYAQKNGVDIAYGSHVRTSGDSSTVSGQATLEVGDYITFGASPTATGTVRFSMTATAESTQIVTPVTSFSTDTATLVHKTTAVASTDAVGTFATYSYAINTNTRTICGSAPTQTTASMNANGIQIFARAYNAASTCGNPSVVAIQIGKGLKGRSSEIYKSLSKVTGGELGHGSNSNFTAQYGLDKNNYDATTGILLIDAGEAIASTNTSREFKFQDSTNQANGYLVINASKTPTLSGVSYVAPRVAFLSEVKANGLDGGPSASGWQTRILNTISDPSGFVTHSFLGTGGTTTQFTLQAGTYYFEGLAPGHSARHKARLRNITSGSTSLVGSTEFAGTNVLSKSTVSGEVTITTATVFELQHYFSAVVATDGLGVDSSGSGENEVYTQLKITKVK